MALPGSPPRPPVPTGFILPDSELQGYLFGGANVCLIFVDMEPGDGPRLHRHAYEEIFIVLEG
jgi:quercetin dioxygenase-like cupin family protein